MTYENLRMIRCDGKECGALETMPEPEVGADSIELAIGPRDWLVCLDPPRAYCPACKFLYE